MRVPCVGVGVCVCRCQCVYIECILTLAQNNGWQFVEPTFCWAADNEIYFGKHMPQIAARVCMSPCAHVCMCVSVWVYVCMLLSTVISYKCEP